MGSKRQRFQDSWDLSGGAAFPPTRWTLIGQLQDPQSETRRQALEVLISRYWRPVFGYLISRGVDPHTAKDLTQEFFTRVLERHTFVQANRNLGQFRNFLKACAENFWKDWRRKLQREQRMNQPLSEDIGAESEAQETGLDAFDWLWIRDHIKRALEQMEQAWAPKHPVHFQIFKEMVIDPIELGVERPKARQVGAKVKLSIAEVNNRLTTAKRAFKRFLEEEIWASSFNNGDFRKGVKEALDFLRGLLRKSGRK